MKKWLNYLKYWAIYIGLIMIGIMIVSLLNLLGLNWKLPIFFNIIIIFILAMKFSLKSKGKGYILGLKLGIFIVITLILMNLIFYKDIFNIKRFIYYVILLISSILGGSLGKNLPKR